MPSSHQVLHPEADLAVDPSLEDGEHFSSDLIESSQLANPSASINPLVSFDFPLNFPKPHTDLSKSKFIANLLIPKTHLLSSSTGLYHSCSHAPLSDPLLIISIQNKHPLLLTPGDPNGDADHSMVVDKVVEALSHPSSKD